MNFKTLLLVLSVFTIISCGDDGAPELTINSPENGASYTAGDVISIVANMTDDVGVSSMSASSSLLAETFTESFSDSPASLTYTLTLDVSGAIPLGEYDITVTATDTDGNTDDEKLTINIE